MRPERAEKHSRTGEKVQVTNTNADEQTRRIHAAIARRAYEIFRGHGSTSGHELEDWRRAEAELVRPLCYGRMALGEGLWLGTEATPFEEGTINVWVAPRRLTICGKPRIKAQAFSPRIRSRPEEEMIFRVADLPVEIDPSKVAAKPNAQSLEILITIAQATPEPKVKAVAA